MIETTGGLIQLYWSHEAPLSSIPTSLSGYLIEIKKQNKKNNDQINNIEQKQLENKKII
jgi:hypothetical protein